MHFTKNRVSFFMFTIAIATVQFIHAADADFDGMTDVNESAYGRNPIGVDWQQLPFVDNFDTYSQGDALMEQDTGWTQLSLNEPLVVGAGVENTKAVDVSDSYLVLPVGEASDQIVWTSLSLDPVLLPRGSSPSFLKDSAVVFYFNQTGEMVIWDAGDWSALALPARQNGLYHVDVASNYTKQVWHLWVNDVALATDIPFAASLNSFGSLRLNQAASIVDSVKISSETAVGGFDAWQRSYDFTSASDASLLADPDQDGWVNQMEYAFGTDPINGSAQPVIGISSVEPLAPSAGNTVRMRFSRNSRAVDMDFLVLSNEDLSTPWEPEPTLNEAIVSQSFGVDVIEVAKTFDGEIGFLKVDVSSE